jgi:hypothetical protein
MTPPQLLEMRPHCALAVAQSEAADIGVQLGSQTAYAALQTWFAPHDPQSV